MKLTKGDLTDSQWHALTVMGRGGMSLALDQRDVQHLTSLGLASNTLGGAGITPAGRELLRRN